MLVNVITAFGWVGAAAGLTAYMMVSRGKWIAASLAFQLTNVIAAGLMSAVAVVNGVWPSAAANMAWIGIGVITIHKILKERDFSLRKTAIKGIERSLRAIEVSSAAANSWSTVGGQGGSFGYGSHSRLAG